MRGLRRRLSYANVIATLALFLALTGSAAAVGKYLTASDPITAGDLAGSTYGSPVIADEKVTSAKITDGAITSSKFDTAAIAPNSDKLDGLDSSAFVQQPGGASLFFASASSTVNIPSTTPVTVASLDVPAGTYLVSAQLAVLTDALFCALQPSGTDAGSNGTDGGVDIMDRMTFEQEGTITVACRRGPVATFAQVFGRRLAALQVTSG